PGASFEAHLRGPKPGRQRPGCASERLVACPDGRLQPGLPRECLWPIALLYLPTLVQSRAFGSFNLQGTRLLPTAIPYAAMSETSSNRWNLSVISDFSFSA